MGKIILIPDSLLCDLPFTEILGQDSQIDLIRLLRRDRVIETVHELRPDVVVLGIRLKEFNPFDCCHIIKTNPQLKDIKVLFVSDEPGSALDDRARALKPELVIDSNHAVERIQTFLNWEWMPHGEIERRIASRFVMDQPIHLDWKNQRKLGRIVNASRTGVFLLAKEPIQPDEVIAMHTEAGNGHPFTLPLRVVRRIKLVRPVRNFSYGIGASYLRPPELMADQLKRVLRTSSPKLLG